MSAEETGEVSEIDDPELAELVAYLDGELSPVDMDRMEQRLIHEDALRRRAESLDRTWRMLDDLSEVAASSEFTARTLQSMQATQADEFSSAAGTSGNRRVMQGTAGLLLQIPIWLATGFLVTSGVIALARSARDAREDAQTRQILENLELLKNYHMYRAVRDIDTLRGLQTLVDSETSGGVGE